MSASPAVVVPQDGKKQLTVWSKSSEICEDLPVNEPDKESSRLGDDITTKVRKPYTITKQRERWTEEEHQSFLEALRLYGRAWRQIEEHVGTKTAVQIRSHAQKFFSKLEREGSSGSSKGPVPEIDIPPPRPKRKPAHPYPRKGIALNSRSTRMQSRSPQISGRNSSGCEVSPNGDDADVEANQLPAPNPPEPNVQHPLNSVSEKPSFMNCCQQPRKRSTEEVQCDAFLSVSQETTKASRSTCGESEPISSPMGVAPPQPDSSMQHNNTMPFGIYEPQVALPYYYSLHSAGTFPNALSLLNSVSKNPGEIPKLEEMSNLASFVAAHAQLGNSLIPWLNQNPVAIAAAAAAAAAAVTTPWPGVGPQSPPPLHLPLRPPADKLDMENQSTVAAAMAAAAAASFADASAWLAFHGAFTHPSNASEVRSLFKPNPVAHSALPEGQQKQSLANSSEGSKNGVTVTGQTSCEEQDASTVDGMQETTAHTNHPNPVRDDNSIAFADCLHKSSCWCEEEPSKKQGNKGHSSTDNSCNVIKEKRKNGFIGISCNGQTGESSCCPQNVACVMSNGINVGRCADTRNDQLDFSSRMYHNSNYPSDGISARSNGGMGEVCANHANDSLLQGDCDYEGKSTGNFTNSGNMEVHVETDVPMWQEIDWLHERHEGTPVKVSPASQGMSSCGSTEVKKDKVNNASLSSSKPGNKQVRESIVEDHQTDDSVSKIIPHEKGGKSVAQAGSKKRRQGGKIMLTHTCTSPKSTVEAAHGSSICRQGAKAKDAQKIESMVENSSNGNSYGHPLSHSQKFNGSKASSSGSSKYSGHGFVPYRRE